MHFVRSSLPALALATLSLAFVLPQSVEASGGKKYRVTITNLTSGQPFTPPIIVTHKSSTDIFALGDVASEEVQQIAENGNGEPLLTALADDDGVHEIVTGTEPLVPANNPGETPFLNTASYVIHTRGSARFLSWISMLICTNDGFTGVDSIRLPNREVTLLVRAYDARTETNTEDFADMVPPCQGLIGVGSDDPGTGESDPLLAEEGVVIPHVGIIGGEDLERSVHDWTDPVAKIEIERIHR